MLLISIGKTPSCCTLPHLLATIVLITPHGFKPKGALDSSALAIATASFVFPTLAGYKSVGKIWPSITTTFLEKLCARLGIE